MNKPLHPPTLTPLERMTVVALKLAIDYDNCNPDVGMGPSVLTLLHGVLQEAKVPMTDIDMTKVEYAGELYRRRGK